MEENQQATARENIMGTMNINPLLVKLSVPMMVSMLVQALYNVVDSIFVSHVSESALTAVSLAFSLQNVMIAVGVGTGVGVNALLSKSLGEKNQGRANTTAENGIFLALCSYVIFFVIGLTCMKPYFYAQTSDPDIALQGNVRVTGLGVEIGFHAGKADDKKDHIAAQGQKNAVLGGRVGPPLILFTQAFGEQGVDAHARAHAHGDHDVLQRERQRNSGQGALADVGHEDRVHHVVQRLHQHGHHHGHTELDQQRIDVHGAHDVLTGRCLLIFFHVDSF